VEDLTKVWRNRSACVLKIGSLGLLTALVLSISATVLAPLFLLGIMISLVEVVAVAVAVEGSLDS